MKKYEKNVKKSSKIVKIDKRGRTKYRVVRAGNCRFGAGVHGVQWGSEAKKGQFMYAKMVVFGVHTFHGFLTFFVIF